MSLPIRRLRSISAARDRITRSASGSTGARSLEVSAGKPSVTSA